ncbi:MAG: hypothetical protein HPY71_14615 [Firmicutes bacterium]|nr:hypothetical protein [Bacillota bacterium]
MENEAAEILREALRRLRESYGERYMTQYFTERDIVRELQAHLIQIANDEKKPLIVIHNYPVERDGKRALLVDLAIISEENKDEKGGLDIAIEFKYEPDHERMIKRPFSKQGILYSKLPVVQRGDVAKDIRRIEDFVNGKDSISGADLLPNIENAYAILIDEGGYHYRYNRKGFEDLGGEWKEWSEKGKVFIVKKSKPHSYAPDIFSG